MKLAHAANCNANRGGECNCDNDPQAQLPRVTIVMGTGAGNMRALAGADLKAGVKAPVKAAPIVQGQYGKAWLCDEAAGLRQMNVEARYHAGVAHWIIEAAWAHPVWHSYSLVLMHLRPMPDGRKTLFYLPDATHELMLHALDPDLSRDELIGNGIVQGWLTPTNFAAQFVAKDDDAARQFIKAAVQMVCDGLLSPDTDFRQQWIELFGDNMMLDRANKQPPQQRGSNQ